MANQQDAAGNGNDESSGDDDVVEITTTAPQQSRLSGVLVLFDLCLCLLYRQQTNARHFICAMARAQKALKKQVLQDKLKFAREMKARIKTGRQQAAARRQQQQQQQAAGGGNPPYVFTGASASSP